MQARRDFKFFVQISVQLNAVFPNISSILINDTRFGISIADRDDFYIIFGYNTLIINQSTLHFLFIWINAHTFTIIESDKVNVNDGNPESIIYSY